MSDNTRDREPIRVFDVQDRMFTLRIFAFSSLVSLGVSFISMALSFQLATPTAPEFMQPILASLYREYFIAGIIAFILGIGGASTERLIINRLRRQRHRTFDPRNNDHFVVVIEGIGSHGNPEREDQVDNIMELTLRDIIASGNRVDAARFYSSAGVRNLLRQQL